MKCKRFIHRIPALLLALCMCFAFGGCRMKLASADLMEGLKKGTVKERSADERFLTASANFSFALFQEVYEAEANTLLSPLSVSIALAMTANGANGQTRDEMLSVLAGDISMDELNEYMSTYVQGLPSTKKSKLLMANAIWMRDQDGTLEVNRDFLQTNLDYFGANAYSAPFDESTKKDINRFAKEKTDGMIREIVDRIDPDTVMYLINAISFDAEWSTSYKKANVREGSFTAYDHESQKVDMMSSREFIYLEDEYATGFLKPYAGDSYSFVGLLPKEGISLSEYVEKITGETFLDMMANGDANGVDVKLPKFSYEDSMELETPLSALSMQTAFTPGADFSRMGSTDNSLLYIGSVLHKTFIAVDEKGTRASAVTKVDMTKSAASPATRSVILNRPFMYAIIDNQTRLPLFLGTVASVE